MQIQNEYYEEQSIKNKKFQKEQLIKEGFHEFKEFYVNTDNKR